jgi:hypothetical protein
LAEHDGEWWPGCGWNFSTVGGTDRVLLSLSRRNLCERYGHNSMGLGKYRITEAGRKAAATLRLSARKLAATRLRLPGVGGC